MRYDYELILIAPGQIVEDEVGNQIETDLIETPVLCGLKSVGRSEFYNAAATGLRSEMVFVIHAYEYNDEKTVKYDGKLYRVMRTYASSFEELELTCERVSADG